MNSNYFSNSAPSLSRKGIMVPVRSTRAVDPPVGTTKDFQVVWKAGYGVLQNELKSISADEVYQVLTRGNSGSAPWLLDTRKPEDNAKGSIPGTKLVVYWTDIPKPETLAKLPRDKEIWVYCATGNVAQSTVAILSMLGYRCAMLEYAIMSWTPSTIVLNGSKRYSIDATLDLGLEKQIDKPVEIYPFPELVTGTQDDREIIRKAAEDAMQRVKVHTVDVEALLADCILKRDPTNVPMVVDNRPMEDYVKGHIPGALNIDQSELLKPDNLNKLSPDKPIVLVDHIGTQSQIAAMVLRMLGYNAASLRWGMMAWTDDDSALGPYRRYSMEQQRDYPIETRN